MPRAAECVRISVKCCNVTD